MNQRQSVSIISALLFTMSLLAAPVHGQNGFIWKAFKPHKSPAPVKVKVLGKALTYYPLEKGEEIVAHLEGPAKIRILTRIEFGTDPRGEKSYYLRFEREDNTRGKFRRVTGVSATAVLAAADSVHLGTSRSIYLDIPEGKHTYRFYVGSKSNYRLYLRFYKREAEIGSRSKNVAFSPVYYTREVPIIVKEEEADYYRVGEQDTVRLSVIGPTTVKVLSRLEFDPTMVTDQQFRVKVFEDGSEKHIFSLRSVPSQIAEYREMSTTVLGKGAQFFIEVPKGKHEYTFEVMDNRRNILLRFFIPRNDLGNNL